jgi:DNA-binding transcriptional LysR family regulator
MKNIDWDDIRCFVAVARRGGLSPAAYELDSSAATLGRRMLSLERRLGRSLFVRRQTGYGLTKDGRDFLALAVAMEASARPIESWLDAGTARPVVRISAGTWTSHFLCENFARIWNADDPFCVALHSTEVRLDISHREVDIGIRNQKPDEPSLAARKTGIVAHGAFRARNAAPATQARWLAIIREQAITQSSRWMNDQASLDVVAYANSPRALYDMIRAGLGNGIIPCFAGDRDPLLERAGAPIAELLQDQWLVMHEEGRNMPHVRMVIDRLGGLLADHAALFSGQRPLGKEG